MSEQAGVLVRDHESRPQPAVSRRWHSSVLLVVRAAVGIALFVYVLNAGGAWGSLRGLLGTVWLVLLLNAIPIVGAAIEAARLRVLFEAQGLTVPFATGFRVVAIGTLFNLWIPGGTGGDVMKLYYLSRRHPGRVVQVATILLVDRLVALCALLILITALLVSVQPLLSTSAVLYRIMLVVPLALLGLLTGTILAWSSSVRTSRPYRVVTGRWPLGRHLVQAADAAYAFRTRKGALLRAGLYSFGGHVLLAIVLALAGTVLVPGVSGMVVALLSLLGLVANVIPVTPGGVGVGEAASEALFRSVGVPGGAALVAAWRAGMVALCVVGAVAYVRGDRRLLPPIKKGRR